MTSYHWKALCQLLWHLGVFLMRYEDAETMIKWHEAIETAKTLPWKGE